MTTCIVYGDNSCRKRVAKVVEVTHGQLPALLDTTYASIRAAAPNVELVVLGYPRLFTPSTTCGALTPAKRSAINDAGDQLSEVMAAARAGALVGPPASGR